MSASAITSRDGEAPAGAQHPRRLARSRAACRAERLMTQLEMTTSTRCVGERDLLDVPLDELDVRDPGLACVRAREVEHLVGHVEAVSPCRSGRRAGPRAARRSRRRSRGRAPSRPRAGRRRRSGCRSRARRATALSGSVAVVVAVERGAERRRAVFGDHRTCRAAARGTEPSWSASRHALAPPPRSGLDRLADVSGSRAG